ncbi:hypothetical protein NC981_19760 [Leptolyngbya sp. DQ-M1]|uniref:hypothetical protein n=1 Tax=Leptolyngbya sp. DQ-M1 TaxID=2933920 RepID=UPI003298D027
MSWAAPKPANLRQPAHPTLEASLSLNQAEDDLDNGQYAKAIGRFQKLLRQAEALKDERQAERAREGIAKAYFLQGQPEIAARLFEQQVARQRAKQETPILSLLLHHLASAYYQVKQYSKAEHALREAIAAIST